MIIIYIYMHNLIDYKNKYLKYKYKYSIYKNNQIGGQIRRGDLIMYNENTYKVIDIFTKSTESSNILHFEYKLKPFDETIVSKDEIVVELSPDTVIKKYHGKLNLPKINEDIRDPRIYTFTNNSSTSGYFAKTNFANSSQDAFINNSRCVISKAVKKLFSILDDYNKDYDSEYKEYIDEIKLWTTKFEQNKQKNPDNIKFFFDDIFKNLFKNCLYMLATERHKIAELLNHTPIEHFHCRVQRLLKLIQHQCRIRVF